MNPYKECPVFENENYLLRFVNAADAKALLRVYSDAKAVPYFNSDNCNGDDFHYTSLERMQSAIEYWNMEYCRQGFVRWTVIDKKMHNAIGMVEVFNRSADDFFNNCGILRLDLRSDYERAEIIREILLLVVCPVFDLFDCQMIAVKVPQFASEREEAVKKLGFIASGEKLIGTHDGKSYSDYYVLKNKREDGD